MKLYLYALAALALLGLLAYGAHIKGKADRTDAAEARADAAEAGRAADMREVVKRLDRDAAQRQELVTRLDGIDKRFGEIVIPKPEKLIQTREVPGACPVIGVSSEFVSVWNNAASP